MAWFNPADENKAVDIEHIQDFLNAAAAVNFMEPMAADGRAKSFIDNGYTSAHAICELTSSDLRGMGFLNAHANKLARYLGEPAVSVQQPQALSDVNTSASMMGAVMASAVADASTVVTLGTATDKRPTVAQCMKWLEAHNAKQMRTGYSLSAAFQALMDDAHTDLAIHITAEPASSHDKAYIRSIMSSLSPQQLTKYGDVTCTSALLLAQKVLKSICEPGMSVYMPNASAFFEFQQTNEEYGVKNRFGQFQSKLMEVRFHKMFEVEEGFKKLVSVINPKQYLLNEVFSKWQVSAKDQSALSRILRHVHTQLDVPDHSPAPKRTDKNERKQTPKSGRSESNKSRGQDLPVGVCHQYYLNGDCGRDPCPFPHVSKDEHKSTRRGGAQRRSYGNSAPNEQRARALAPPPYNSKPRVPSVNHVQLLTSRLAESENAVGRLNETVLNLTGQLEDNTAAMTAIMYSQLNGDVFYDCSEWNDEYYDCSEVPSALPVVQATTRSTTLRRQRAPTEMERLRATSRLAKIASHCNLKQGPVIDSATDLDIISSSDLACAEDVQSCTPVEFSTVSGNGVSKQRADLHTPLVSLIAAPVVKSAPNSIVSTSTIHDAGFTVVSSSKGMTLHKDGTATEAVPSGNMYRLPVTEGSKVDAEVNFAVAQHRTKIMARVLKKLILHRKRGHRPTDPWGCPDECGLQLSRKPATKSKPSSRHQGDSRGYVTGLDYITGFPADNDGNTAALGLVVAPKGGGRSVAWYQPVTSHSGSDAIAAFNECEFQISRMFPPGEFKISRVHSDCEPSLIGPLAAVLKARGIWPTNTEGYDHNGNAVVEGRNKLVQRGIRSALITATGGRNRYTEVWGTTLVHINDCINHTSYAGEQSPVESAGGEPVDLESDNSHVYGAHTVHFEAKERRDAKLDSPGRISMYAGRSFVIPGGHRVIELEWNHTTKRFDFSPTRDVKTVRVDDTRYPLTQLPLDGNCTKQSFDDFISMFDPRSVKIDVYEVQKLLLHRLRGIPGSSNSSFEYLVHWKGYSKAAATWEPEHHLVSCGAARLVKKYKAENVPKVCHLSVVDPDYLATHEVMQRHKLKGPFQKCLNAYKLEFKTVMGLRMVEIEGDERERVLREEKAPHLRMNPEPKPDGRLKMRLIVRGDCEPEEWTNNMSLDSPTPASSSVKMMMAMSDETDEVEELSIGDVATAFLKGEKYSETDRDRWVVFRQYRGAKLRVFKLLGSLYGQRDAPVRWYNTFRKHLLSEGFKQCKNDVCMFRHPVTLVKVLVWVDDNFVRGVRRHTDAFWKKLDEVFGLKSFEYLETGVSRTFLGLNFLKSSLNGQPVYCIDQNADMRALLMEHPVVGVPLKSPMRDRKDLYVNDTPTSKAETKWFRSVLMSLSYYACWTRLDIACPVNRLAQKLSAPTVSALDELKRILRYLNGRPDFTLVAKRPKVHSNNEWIFYVDSDLAGEAPYHTRSRTGAITLLNGMPMQWRSNKQPQSVFSSAAAEVYAFSEAVKDARVLLWRAEEMGMQVKYPFKMLEDNAATVSFQKSTTPYSKLRGVYNLRDNWVQELKDKNVVSAVKVHTDLNVADLFTKCHEWHKMKKLLNLIQLDKEPNLEFRGCVGI